MSSTSRVESFSYHVLKGTPSSSSSQLPYPIAIVFSSISILVVYIARLIFGFGFWLKNGYLVEGSAILTHPRRHLSLEQVKQTQNMDLWTPEHSHLQWAHQLIFVVSWPLPVCTYKLAGLVKEHLEQVFSVPLFKDKRNLSDKRVEFVGNRVWKLIRGRRRFSL